MHKFYSTRTQPERAMRVRKSLSERVSLEISVRTVRGRRRDWNLETSMCGESCPDILKTVQVSIYRLKAVQLRRNIPSLMYSQYIAELKSLPIVCALSRSRVSFSLSLSLCGDHAEGISVMQCFVFSRTRKNAIVVTSKCPSWTLGPTMPLSVGACDECGRNRSADACESASTAARTGVDTSANCKPWMPNNCPRSHISSCIYQPRCVCFSRCKNVPMELSRSDNGEAARATRWVTFPDPAGLAEDVDRKKRTASSQQS